MKKSAWILALLLSVSVTLGACASSSLQDKRIVIGENTWTVEAEKK